MLSDALHNSESSDVLFVGGDGVKYLRPDIQIWVESVRGESSHLCGANIYLQPKSNLELALSLLLLDGLARRIYLTPEGVGLPENEFNNLNSKLSIPQLGLLGLEAEIEIQQLAAGVEVKTAWDGETQWILATSGTTNVPKFVCHTLNGLARTVQTESKKGRSVCWGLLYDISRFAGLQVFLQALLGGGTLILTHENATVADQLTHFVKNDCNALSGTPTLWRKILMTPGAAELNLKLVTLGGEIAEQSVLDSLVKKFPNAKIRHIYASTEVGVGFSVSDVKEGFPASWFVNPPNGIELALTESGCLKVKSTNIRQSYLTGGNILSDGGYADTGDMIEIVEGRALFKGRANGTINVGGNKVQPEEIEKVIHAVNGVAIAQVSGLANSMMGNLVVAKVVAHSGVDHAELKSSVMLACRSQLEAYERPAMLQIVEDVVISAVGKTQRK